MSQYKCNSCKKEFSRKAVYNNHLKVKTTSQKDLGSKRKNQNVGLKRDTTDKYYTSSSVVDQCFTLIKKYIKFDSNDLCIEPSAGDGAFIKAIKSNFKNYKFYDLEPAHPEIIQQDYLIFDYDKLITKKYNQVHVVGNPPFGRQSSLAIKFIKISAQYADTISFILPKSFAKESLKKHFPLNFHLEHQYELPKNSFLINGEIYDVPCIFQIWIKKSHDREKSIKLVPNKFQFTTKDKNPDISFRRVGVNAGSISKKIDDKAIQSHYFIKFDHPLSETIIKKLSNITFISKNHTVGPKSISKQELIKEFNQILS